VRTCFYGDESAYADHGRMNPPSTVFSQARLNMHPSRPISRILFPCAGRQSSIWDARCRAPRCGLPGAQRVRAAPCFHEGNLPLLGLAPGGVYLARAVTSPAGGLLHRRFTLAPLKWHGHFSGSRFAFCGTMPSGHPAWRLASTVLCGVRTFLTPCGVRLPGRLGCTFSIVDGVADVKSQRAGETRKRAL